MKHKKRLFASLLCCVLLFSACTPSDSNTMSDSESSTVTTAEDSKESLYVNVDFSVGGGYYKDKQSVVLSLPENAPKGTYLTYTTNGNIPQSTDKKHSSSVELSVLDKSECDVIRAACFDKNGKNIGRIKTNTYIKSGTKKVSAPYVVSIVADDSDLYGENGIITNYKNSGKDWERVCHVEIFDKNGEEVISQNAGLRIFGGSSRSSIFKSFRLVARRDGYYDETMYNGNGSFDYAFFSERTVINGESAGEKLQRFDRLVLRNGGNDSFLTSTDADRVTINRDAAANLFAMKYAPKVASQASCFVSVYLNGEYYGILDMKEDIDEDYISNVYGITDKENVTVIKSELDTERVCTLDHGDEIQCGRFCGAWFYYEVDQGPENALDEYIALCERAVNCSDSEYENVFKEVSKKIDLENFIQYTAINLFICNTDWGHNNLKLWRYNGTSDKSNEYTDGKWRFAMRDCDFAFGRYKSSHILPELYTLADMDMFNFVLANYYSGEYEYTENYADPLYLKGLLAFCLKNSNFRTEFEEYCRTLASDEAAEYLKGIFKAQLNTLSPLVTDHLDRWNGYVESSYSTRTWRKQMLALDDWATKRPQYFISHMESALAYFC